ncbi:phosphatase PAP2 family protein [Corynebacterium epidermidicanis]|uniref:5'-phosphoribosyl-monophospho-decaprenol phosphatase n=1 Tax=Corynebacterium epidermidicanis TaxID=1050174 RepID=A0A0G3GSS9_9CORY|nr:phosphatase PAP2 family protein [Corynebacterium epidermidicanis]AKK04159.1 5'-phosphoribosyl-monophospho-decaprenol phosphatase [Corynebacterium epidermidicanis]
MFSKSSKEADILVEVQRALLGRPGVVGTARGMSLFGEHAAGWLALGAAGAVVDKPRRRKWVALVGAAFVSHAASVVIKRIVRRPRPTDPRIEIGVGTPSSLSFPSSHATSTTAALVSLSMLLGKKWPLLGVPLMMLSRMVLGVHYPTDVATGAALGAATAVAASEIEKRSA